MATKTLAQLKKEVSMLKKKNQVQQTKLSKKNKEALKMKKLEKELKQLKESPFIRKLKNLKKTNLKKENFVAAGGKLKTGTNKLLKNTKWVVDRLDRLGR